MIKLVLIIFFSTSLSYAVNSPAVKIKHPAAKTEGLSRIDADGKYIYDIERPLKNKSSHIRIGQAATPDIEVQICSDENCSSSDMVSYKDIYGETTNMSFGYDYEYFFTTVNGKLGLQAGFGFQLSNGEGRLKSDPTVSSIEKFNFVTLPMYFGAVYRFEYKDKQFFAPYVAGGAVYVGLLEKREDVSKVNAIGAPGYFTSGGLLFNITALSRDMANTFESEYNISNMWLNFEFKIVQVSNEVFKYNNSYVQGGLSFDF